MYSDTKSDSLEHANQIWELEQTVLYNGLIGKLFFFQQKCNNCDFGTLSNHCCVSVFISVFLLAQQKKASQ